MACWRPGAHCRRRGQVQRLIPAGGRAPAATCWLDVSTGRLAQPAQGVFHYASGFRAGREGLETATNPIPSKLNQPQCNDVHPLPRPGWPRRGAVHCTAPLASCQCESAAVYALQPAQREAQGAPHQQKAVSREAPRETHARPWQASTCSRLGYRPLAQWCASLSLANSRPAACFLRKKSPQRSQRFGPAFGS